jgi:hypothetical protein
MGRIDDVLNVAGHRLGTMEIESALVSHARVAEAAVVGKPHEIKGEAVFAYVVCKGSRPSGDLAALTQELRNWVGEQLGAIAKPDEIRFTETLPKTRSGKIMRRLLRAVARGEAISQDVSTLENPAIIDQLRGIDPGTTQSAPAARSTARAAGKRRSKRTATATRGSRKSRGRAAAKPAARAKPARRAAAKKSATRTKRSKTRAAVGPRRPARRTRRRTR